MMLINFFFHFFFLLSYLKFISATILPGGREQSGVRIGCLCIN